MTEAVRKAGAADLVRALPGGYDQILGTEFADGEQLSGGQWQSSRWCSASARAGSAHARAAMGFPDRGCFRGVSP